MALPADVQIPKVEIHVTEVCNNRCGFCSTGWNNARGGDDVAHVPRDVIRRQLAEAYAGGARRVLFQGGEPTVRRDLAEIVAEALEIGFVATTLFTNARMAASVHGARWLADMRFSWFQISIQGGTAAAHDASVGAPQAFKQTVAGTRRLLDLGQRVKINAVLTRHLLESLPAFAALMIALRPEEVGFDTVKPGGAFAPGLARYDDLAPKLSPYSEALRDALVAMNDAGVIARATSFPPCLVRGAEAYVSEESDTTRVATGAGRVIRKLEWKRSMQVKSEVCAQCAYDDRCGGVYDSYAEAWGLGELTPLAARAQSPAVASPSGPMNPLLRALKRALVRTNARGFGVRDVRGHGDGIEIVCFGPGREARVVFEPEADGPAYARTRLFRVRYLDATPDHALVDAAVRTIAALEDRIEPLLHAASS